MDDQNYGNCGGEWLQNPVLTLGEVIVTAWAWHWWRLDLLWWMRP